MFLLFARLVRQRLLTSILADIAENDTNYDKRYGLVLWAVAVAHRCGYASGFRIDLADPEWPVAFIELPTGQVSWHLPQHPFKWDGHETPLKFKRIADFVASVKKEK